MISTRAALLQIWEKIDRYCQYKPYDARRRILSNNQSIFVACRYQKNRVLCLSIKHMKERTEIPIFFSPLVFAGMSLKEEKFSMSKMALYMRDGTDCRPHFVFIFEKDMKPLNIQKLKYSVYRKSRMKTNSAQRRKNKLEFRMAVMWILRKTSF